MQTIAADEDEIGLDDAEIGELDLDRCGDYYSPTSPLRGEE
jgi:hypothetical protein